MVFPTEEWVSAWVSGTNANPDFRSTGQGWDGAACLIVRDTPGCSADGLMHDSGGG